MAASEAGIISDVLTILKRLDAAVTAKDGAESASLLSALDAQPVTLPVLTKTKCGVVVGRLRSHEHAATASKAAELVKKWKKVAEDAGVGSAAARAPAAPSPSASSSSSSSSAASASSSSTPAPTLAVPEPAAAASAEASGSSASAASPALTSPGGSGAAGGTPKPYVPTGLTRVALPTARAGPRKILMEAVVKVVKQQLAAAAAAPDAPPPALSPADAEAQAADVGAAIEDALYAAVGNPDPSKPGDAYAQQFRTLAMGLPRNPPLVMNAVAGDLPLSELVRYSSDQLTSDEARKKAEDIRRQQCVGRRGAAWAVGSRSLTSLGRLLQASPPPLIALPAPPLPPPPARSQESMQLDWMAKNKKKLLEAAGLQASEGALQCGRCKSRNTEYYQKQTRSADEPMTTCVWCGAGRGGGGRLRACMGTRRRWRGQPASTALTSPPSHFSRPRPRATTSQVRALHRLRPQVEVWVEKRRAFEKVERPFPSRACLVLALCGRCHCVANRHAARYHSSVPPA